MNPRIFSFLLLLVSAFYCSTLLWSTSDNFNNKADKQVEQLIMKLSSAEDNERQMAKAELIQMGTRAVEPLMNFLEDLVKNPGPRYVTGKEQEGAKVAEQYKILTISKQPTSEYRAELAALEISVRLKRDVYEILGKLKAIETIPTLIAIMQKREAYNGDEFFNDEMSVLVEIGTPAVPHLIDTIEKAEATAASLLQSTLLDESLNREKVRQMMMKRDAQLIKLRAAMVLGEIGDATALPVLNHLLTQEISDLEGSQYFVYRVKEAIEKIKKKNNLK